MEKLVYLVFQEAELDGAELRSALIDKGRADAARSRRTVRDAARTGRSRRRRPAVSQERPPDSRDGFLLARESRRSQRLRGGARKSRAQARRLSRFRVAPDASRAHAGRTFPWYVPGHLHRESSPSSAGTSSIGSGQRTTSRSRLKRSRTTGLRAQRFRAPAHRRCPRSVARDRRRDVSDRCARRPEGLLRRRYRREAEGQSRHDDAELQPVFGHGALSSSPTCRSIGSASGS